MRRLRRFLLIMLAALTTGCTHVSKAPPDLSAFRYKVTAYDKDGVEIGETRFGERFRGGKVVVEDSLNPRFRLRVNPTVGLDIINGRADSQIMEGPR
jgi:hypothetical protein